MTKDFYLDILGRLKALPSLRYVNVWNGQLDSMEQGTEMSWPCPAAFVEVVNEQPINQLGDSIQIYDPIIVRIHLLHEYYNNTDSEAYERNLDVFDVKQEIYATLQGKRPDKCAAFVRSSETQDYAHTNIYHFLIDFTTNFVDDSVQYSTTGVVIEDPATTITIEVQPELDIDNIIIRTGDGT